VILPDVAIGKHCYIKKAILDKGCRVPDGMIIGEDLEEDRERFYITEEEGVVLVTPEMLGQKYRYIR
jgi:glucose-1-phosphate adenylyltransferase